MQPMKMQFSVKMCLFNVHIHLNMIQIRPDIRLAWFLLLPFDALSIVYSLLRFSLILVSSHISCV